LQQVLAALLAGTRRWSRGEAVDAELSSLRRQALLLAHAHYVESIPVYRRLAEDCGLLEVDDPAALADHLLLGDEIFKSYDPRWLEDGDFPALTAWLRDRYAHPIGAGPHAASDLADWRRRLKSAGVLLTLSSGTSGRLSFVPRDRFTLDAMRHNGSVYYHRVWEPAEDGGYGEFDILVLGFRGTSLGLQSAGEGLARMAARAHFLFDRELSPEDLRRTATADAAGAPRIGGPEREAAYRRSLDFLRRGAAEGRRVIVFGAPLQVHELCGAVAGSDAAGAGCLLLAAGSLVLSGGGWKSFDGRRVPRDRLVREVTEHLSVPPSHAIDTFSTAELNCVFMTCAEGRYHVPPLVEAVVLGDDLTALPGGEGRGLLGVLDPFALSYPGFLTTGDQVELIRGPCPCGLRSASLVGEVHRAPGREVKGCGGVLASTTA
jgi:hypothetical protein